MLFDRRTLFAAPVALALGSRSPPAAAETPVRYGQVGKLKAKAGRRDEVAALILAGTRAMPGCLSYIVALDRADPDAIWVTEAWNSKASHDGSLTIPAVRAAIKAAMPLIAGFEPGAETIPVGGYGLGPAAR